MLCALRKKLRPGQKYRIDRTPGSAAAVSAVDQDLLPDEDEDPAAKAEKADTPTKDVQIPLTNITWDDPELKEIAQNAAALSEAAYAETELECEKYLTERCQDHGVTSVVRSLHGRTKFLLAEQHNTQSRARLYIAFR